MGREIKSACVMGRTIIRRIDAYTTAAGTQDATKAFFRQQFGTTYNDAIAGLEV